MKKLLTDPAFSHWRICSLALYAAREGLVNISLNTWYRYADLLGLKRRVRPKKRYGPGLRAKAPDEIWHADVLVRRTKEGRRVYLYLVMDNFSRRILAQEVSERLSGEIRKATLERAWTEAIRARGHDLQTELVVDGGPENVNTTVDDFLKSASGGLKRLVAQRDIRFSNSMIEATNKIFAYRYLPVEVANTQAFRAAVERFVREHNTERPQFALGGLTPDEVHYATRCPLPLAEWRAQAREQRLRTNLSAKACKVCE